jgi:membrane fusion protein, copper/silver efflux system
VPDLETNLIAVVSYALPQFDNVSRTLKLRLELDNPGYDLKPDMFVDVELPVELPEALVVPAEAVLDSGLRQTVFVERGAGLFEPRNVHLGRRVGDLVQVLQGLEPSERIVVSGNFLLDSESRMKLAASGIRGTPVTDPVCGMTVDEGQAKAAKRVSEYQGRTYGFCSDGGKKKFDADPAECLAKAKTRSMSTATAEPKPTTDAVCGMKVNAADAKAAKLTSEHQGKTYFFCNQSCKQKFDEAPGKYAMTSEAKTSDLPQTP